MTTIPQPQTEAPDIYLVTDGSGHADGFGGWASEIISGKIVPVREEHYIMGSAAGIGDVFRMEMTALATALTFCFNRWTLWGRLEHLHQNPLRIRWFNDNEALVNCVRRDIHTGKPLYQRRVCEDLWAQIAWFENFVILDANFVSRETDVMKIVDWYASTSRVSIKNFTTANPYEDVKNATRPANVL